MSSVAMSSASTSTASDSSCLFHHHRDPGVYRNRLRAEPGLLAVMIELESRARPEDQAVGRAAEMEHAELRALSDALPFVRSDLATRHFRHPDREEAHEPDARVVSLDEDDRAGGDLRD